MHRVRAVTRPTPLLTPTLFVVAAAALLAGLLAGCRQPSMSRSLVRATTYDLVASLPAARVVEPTRRIDLGTNVARPALLSGWSWNETADDGTTFVWATGEESYVRLELNGLRPDEVRFRVRPLDTDPDSPAAASVELVIGDFPLARTTLEPGFSEVRLAVDPAAWPAADAVLRLRHSPKPAREGEGGRRLATAWDWIELGFAQRPGPEAAEPPEAGRDHLEIPPGLRLDYPVDLEAGSRLAVDSIRPDGESLIVVVTPRAGAQRSYRLTAEGRGSQRSVDLEVEELTTATLSLVPDSDGSGRRLVLERPVIVLPPTPSDS